MKLYEISQRYRNLEELLDNPDIPRGAVQDSLNEIGEEFETKAENIAKLIKNMDGDIEILKSEEKRLSSKRKAIENNQKRLKDYLDAEMKATGKTLIKGTIFKLAIQKNAPSVNVIDEKLIPESYWVEQEPVLDKKTLLVALKNGEEIPGVEIKQTESLRIR